MRTPVLGVVMAAMAAAVAAGGPPPAERGVPLASLNRLLRLFDFEEADHAPHTMPINFYRYIAPTEGFPRFGSMQLSDQAAFDGRWSFEFALEGGSLSARVPTAVLPVLPNSDYTISVRVRTLGLKHARARLVAALHDVHGDLLPSTLVASPLMTTAGAWHELTVTVKGDDDRAADLVVELQVLQPRQYVPLHERGHRPLLEDVTGHVWFDELAIWQQPQVEITTGAAGEVIGPKQPRTLHLLVRDPTPDLLRARVRVEGVDGAAILEERFVLEQSGWEGMLDLDHLPGGWYRASLDVLKADGELVAQRRLDFVICPPGPRRYRATDREFGVILRPNEDPDTTVALVRLLGNRTAVVPIGRPPEALHADVASQREPQHEAIIEALMMEGVELTVWLADLPELMARKLGVPPDQALALVAGDARAWRSVLGPEMGEIVPTVPRWLIGRPGALRGTSTGEVANLARRAARSLAQIVPGPVVLVPFFAHDPLPSLPSPHMTWVHVPHEARPESLTAYASRMGETGPFSSTLQRLPADEFPPLERIGDLVARALAAWRGGMTRLSIEAPWHRGPEPRSSLMPDPTFGPWRLLGDLLPGRRFAGEVPIGDGLVAWILDGPGDDDAMCVWSERRGKEPTEVTMFLGPRAVTEVDLFGNRRPLLTDADGVHRFRVGELPIFLEGIDGNLAQFRAGFAIEPAFIPARRQIHEARIALTNPWNHTVFGTVQLAPDAEWRLTPRSQRFVLGPGERTTLPMELVFERGMISGQTQVDAVVELVTDHHYRFGMSTDVMVGLEDIEFTCFSKPVGDDLVIGATITSFASEPVNLYCQVIAQGVTHQRRSIVGLRPGQTTKRTFRLTGARQRLAGQVVSVAVSETEGNGRANLLLQIPAEPQPRSTVEVGGG
jgi:hypothetical protein